MLGSLSEPAAVGTILRRWETTRGTATRHGLPSAHHTGGALKIYSFFLVCLTTFKSSHWCWAWGAGLRNMGNMFKCSKQQNQKHQLLQKGRDSHASRQPLALMESFDTSPGGPECF